MKKRKKGRRFPISANRPSSPQRTSSMEPEDLAVYIRRAEKEVLPIIKEMHLGPGAAQFLLAQQTQVLVTGDPRLTVESGMAIATSVLALWQEGYYTPGPAYPYTLEETLLELQEGPKAKGNYQASFQPFTPAKNERRGLPMVGTESRNSNLAQKSYGSLKDILEKLFGRGGRLSKGAMVALSHAFREGEVIFPLHIDVLKTQWS